jgi:hypothetical protein
MKSVWCCTLFLLGLMILPCMGEMPVGDSPGSPVTLVLYLEAENSADALDSMQRELDAVFEPAGVTIGSRLADQLTGSETFARLAVIHFKGSCKPNRGTAAFLPGPLGWAHITDGEIVPFISVDCSRIYGLISTELPRDDTPQRSRIFGRALARVVAHEVYHVLTRTKRHARRGIAKAVYTANDLLSDRLVFDRQQAQMLFRPRYPRASQCR